MRGVLGKTSASGRSEAVPRNKKGSSDAYALSIHIQLSARCPMQKISIYLHAYKFTRKFVGTLMYGAFYAATNLILTRIPVASSITCTATYYKEHHR